MLPEKYKFLETIGTLPKIVQAALNYLGLKEYPGSANNPVIMDMAKSIGVEDIYLDDSKQAWCAIFMFHLLKITGKPFPPVSRDRYDYLRAYTFTRYGEAVAKGDEKLGDICVKSRSGGNHVFIFIGKTPAGNFIGIGGNQSNAVTFAEFDKDDIVATRRFYATAPPASVKLYIIDSEGHTSTNES